MNKSQKKNKNYKKCENIVSMHESLLNMLVIGFQTTKIPSFSLNSKGTREREKTYFS
jgi:hypothetical protein